MPLMTVEEFIETQFTPNSRPLRRTVWYWIRSGKLPAERRGRRYYIDLAKVRGSSAEVRRILHGG